MGATADRHRGLAALGEAVVAGRGPELASRDVFVREPRERHGWASIAVVATGRINGRGTAA
ncbi:hypothetical protein [Streptomyces cavernae]|uniref:hypothetical protein n=1 Tax=Streptomyces cavernae TaxID=2259034 RepID=UPI000FEB8A28|nr:hypothetical protein [Streptomyces cavernae]